jgi:GDPmannose 4,6-dehydratase
VNKKFFVIGVNGQDGKYISELIIQSQNKVIGVAKQNKSKFFKNSKYFNYIKLNLERPKILSTLLKKYKPDFILNFAALHGSSEVNWNVNFQKSFKVNSLPTKLILDYISNYNPKCFYFYASSMRCLKNSKKINEKSIRVNEDFYQISKNISEILINTYRKKFNIKSSICWFFQHESSIRGKEFFIPKIINILKKSIGDKSYFEKVNNLNFYCDWGSAEEYMKLVYKISLKKLNEDFVIGTGKTLKGNSFVKILFKKYGLNYKNHVGTNNNKKINKKFLADISKLKKLLNDHPVKNIYNLCDDMLMSKKIYK